MGGKAKIKNTFIRNFMNNVFILENYKNFDMLLIAEKQNHISHIYLR